MASETENKQGGARVRVPPPLVFLIAIGAGVLLETYVLSVPSPLHGVRFGAAFILALPGVALVFSALHLFERTGQKPEPWKPSPVLIARGPYRYSRNPMYLSMGLFECAIGLAFDNLWIVILSAPALLAVHHLAVLPEERYLTGRFGESYRRYMAAVPRYIGARDLSEIGTTRSIDGQEGAD